MYHSERFENLRTSSHCPNTESSPPVSLLRDVSLNSSWRLASNSYASSSLLLEKHSQFQIWLFFTLICKQPFPYFTAVLHYKKVVVFFFPSLLPHFLDWKFHSFSHQKSLFAASLRTVIAFLWTVYGWCLTSLVYWQLLRWPVSVHKAQYILYCCPKWHTVFSLPITGG